MRVGLTLTFTVYHILTPFLQRCLASQMQEFLESPAKFHPDFPEVLPLDEKSPIMCRQIPKALDCKKFFFQVPAKREARCKQLIDDRFQAHDAPVPTDRGRLLGIVEDIDEN